MARSSLRKLPSAAHNALAESSLYDHYGKEAVILPGDTKKEVRYAEAFDNEFSLLADAQEFVPVHIFKRQKEVYDKFLGLFGGRTGYVHMPTPDIRKGVVVCNPTSETVFPGATAETIDNATFETLPNNPPVYARSLHNGVLEEIDNREALQDDSLLTPAQRKFIERNNCSVVYESSPKNADRLVVFIRHFHGNIGSAWEARAYGEDKAMQYMRHQQDITYLTRELSYTVAPEKARIIAESSPLDPNSQKARIHRGVSCMVMQNAQKQKTSKLLKKGAPWAEQEYTDHPRFSLYAMARSKGMGPAIYGDGRDEQNYEELDEDYTRSLVSAHRTSGGVGVAANLNEQRSALDWLTMNHTHQRITQQLLTHLPKDGLAIIPYGAGHFTHGNDPYIDPLSTNSFEEYLSFLPRTQVVVVQQNDEVEIAKILMEKNTDEPIEVRNQRRVISSLLDSISHDITSCIMYNREGKQTPHKYISLRELINIRNELVSDLRAVLAKKDSPASHKPSRYTPTEHNPIDDFFLDGTDFLGLSGDTNNEEQ